MSRISCGVEETMEYVLGETARLLKEGKLQTGINPQVLEAVRRRSGVDGFNSVVSADSRTVAQAMPPIMVRGTVAIF